LGKRLVAILLLAFVLIPGAASAVRREPMQYCTSVEISWYGKPTTVVPLTCVNCAYMVCSRLPQVIPPELCDTWGGGTIPASIHIRRPF
jgi:hypothetical protein